MRKNVLSGSGKPVPGTFLYYSTIAAKLEQEGEFKLADENWTMAEKRAEKEVNKAWAKCRAHFCQKAASDKNIFTR